MFSLAAYNVNAQCPGFTVLYPPSWAKNKEKSMCGTTQAAMGLIILFTTIGICVKERQSIPATRLLSATHAYSGQYSSFYWISIVPPQEPTLTRSMDTWSLMNLNEHSIEWQRQKPQQKKNNYLFHCPNSSLSSFHSAQLLLCCRRNTTPFFPPFCYSRDFIFKLLSFAISILTFKRSRWQK